MSNLHALDLLKEQVLLNRNKNCESIDLEHMFLSVLGTNRSDFYTKTHYLSTDNKSELCEMISRRNSGEPLAYILGRKGFWNIDLIVNEHVLVPRPETEIIIKLVLNLYGQKAIQILDAGTGSGAIALALASERKNWIVYALDKSQEALNTAQVNMQNLCLHINLLRSDWLDSVKSLSLDVITSNPPYVSAKDPRLKADGVIKEPLEALVSGHEGLADLNKIIKESFRCLVNGGRFLVEHAPEQSNLVKEFFKESNYTAIEVHKDLNGDKRISTGIKQ